MTNPFANPPQQQQAPAPPAGGNPFGAPPQQPPAQPQQQQQTAPPAQQRPPAQDQEFGQPSSGGGSVITQNDWRSYVGHLMLFEVVELRQAVPTNNGPADAINATVHVIDYPGEPQVHDDSLVFPPALVTALKKAAHNGGGMVLGRLQAYTTKAGRETVDLGEHSPQDADTARRYLAWRASQNVQQPTTQAPQQAQQQTAPYQEEPPF